MPFEVRLEAIEPKDKDYPLNLIASIEHELQRTLNGPVKRQLKNAFEKRTKNWRRKPQWVGRYAYQALAGGRDISLTVYPRGPNRKIYEWTTLGTRSHIITTRTAPQLRFRRYTPKTYPGNKYGGPGRYYGPVMTAQTVMHPGTKAREFEKHVVDEEFNSILLQVRQAVQRALR